MRGGTGGGWPCAPNGACVCVCVRRVHAPKVGDSRRPSLPTPPPTHAASLVGATAQAHTHTHTQRPPPPPFMATHTYLRSNQLVGHGGRAAGWHSRVAAPSPTAALGPVPAAPQQGAAAAAAAAAGSGSPPLPPPAAAAGAAAGGPGPPPPLPASAACDCRRRRRRRWRHAAGCCGGCGPPPIAARTRGDAHGLFGGAARGRRHDGRGHCARHALCARPPRPPRARRPYRGWRGGARPCGPPPAAHDPATVVGCDGAWIRAQCPAGTPAAEVDAALALVRYVRQDLCTNAQCTTATAWLLTGFGFWTKVCPGFAPAVLAEAARVCTAAGVPCRVESPAHLICPPLRGLKLRSHIDGDGVAALRATLGRFLAAGGRSNSGFCAHNGAQTLVHLEGGRPGSGATCTLAPMTPARMALLLDTIAHAPGAEEQRFGRRVARAQVLRALEGGRGVLRGHRRPPPARRRRRRRRPRRRRGRRRDGPPARLDRVPMVPPPGAEPGPFVVAFWRGAFHRKEANTAPRLSLAGGLAAGAAAPAAEDDGGGSCEATARQAAQAGGWEPGGDATDPRAVDRARAGDGALCRRRDTAPCPWRPS